MYDIKQNLENENKNLKTIIEQVKIEYQELNKENEGKNYYINYYKEYVEDLTNQIQKLSNNLEEMRHEQYYYSEPVKKKTKICSKR